MLQRINDDKNIQRKLLEITGIDKQLEKRAQQPVYRYQSAEKSNTLELDHYMSPHCRSLQHSKFISIENNYERIKTMCSIDNNMIFSQNQQSTKLL